MEVLTLWRCAVRLRSAGLNLAPLVSCCQLFSEEDTVVFVCVQVLEPQHPAWGWPVVLLSECAYRETTAL